MRHRKGFNHLSRTSAHRKAMMANMASSLILHKRIRTTTAKAKALRTYVEPLITKSKEDSTHSRRVVFRYLQDKNAVSELFREISPKIMERPGGYTRILKIGNRLGDNADLCIIELVDYNENLLESQEAAKAKSTRRRRGRKKSADAADETAGARVKETETEMPAETPEEKSPTTGSVEDEARDVEVKEEPTAPAKTEEKVEEVKAEEPAPARTDDKVEEVKAEEEPSDDQPEKKEVKNQGADEPASTPEAGAKDSDEAPAKKETGKNVEAGSGKTEKKPEAKTGEAPGQTEEPGSKEDAGTEDEDASGQKK